MPDPATPRHPPVGAAVLGSVAAGGVIGSVARYGLIEAVPRQPDAFPWATFAVNVLGCFAIGVLLAVLSPRSHPLLRPFLGTGILGGFTTFSTYAVETEQLIAHRPVVAVLYFFGTLVAALAAVRLGEAAAATVAGPGARR